MNFFKIGLLGLALLFCTPLFAKNIAKISSKNGMVILKNGEKISGELHFYYRSELIQIVESSKKSKAFTAHQVDRFRFYDDKFETDRIFISLELQQQSYKGSGFYEVISWGAIEVLGKLKYEDKSHLDVYKIQDSKTERAFLPRLIAHDYFVFYEDGFLPLKQYHKKVLSNMCEENETLAEYIKTEHIYENDVYGQLQIIAYYNEKVSDINYDMREFIK